MNLHTVLLYNQDIAFHMQMLQYQGFTGGPSSPILSFCKYHNGQY